MEKTVNSAVAQSGKSRQTARFVEWTSPCGKLVLASLDDELLMCDWADGWHHQTIMKRFKIV